MLKSQIWEISRLFPETKTKLYFHEFRLWLWPVEQWWKWRGRIDGFLCCNYSCVRGKDKYSRLTSGHTMWTQFPLSHRRTFPHFPGPSAPMLGAQSNKHRTFGKCHHQYCPCITFYFPNQIFKVYCQVPAISFCRSHLKLRWVGSKIENKVS